MTCQVNDSTTITAETVWTLGVYNLTTADDPGNPTETAEVGYRIEQEDGTEIQTGPLTWDASYVNPDGTTGAYVDLLVDTSGFVVGNAVVLSYFVIANLIEYLIPFPGGNGKQTIEVV